LPQPASFGELSVTAQDGDPASMLTLYRAAIVVRRQRLSGDAALRWIEAGDDVLAFRRGGVACVVNLAADPIRPPEGAVLLASSALAGGLLPPDTALWIELPNHCQDPEPNPEQ
jgi:alpha-glucosidase